MATVILSLALAARGSAAMAAEETDPAAAAAAAKMESSRNWRRVMFDINKELEVWTRLLEKPSRKFAKADFRPSVLNYRGQWVT
jgi:predicted RNA methylase